MEKEYNFKIYTLSSSEEPEIVRYVGLTSRFLDKRLRIHINDAKRGVKNYRCNWIRSVLKNGYKVIINLLEDNIKTLKEACEKEIQYIKLFKSFGAKLVNGTIGGEGVLGYKLTPEQILNASKCHIGVGFISVDQYNMKGNFIKTWDSIKEAGNELNISCGSISSVCRNNRKTIGGFIWKYKEDKLNLNDHKNILKRTIIQYDLEGMFIKEWDCAKDAATKLKVAPTNIIRCCRGKVRKIRGYIWKYKGDKLNLNDHKNIQKKPIIQYSLDGEFIKEWDSIKNAGEELNLNSGAIQQCCSKKTTIKTSGGFIWKYKGDKLNLEEHIYKNSQSIPVLQLDLNNNILKNWNSINEAAKSNGIFGHCISRCCKGKQKISGGYKWKFKKLENELC